MGPLGAPRVKYGPMRRKWNDDLTPTKEPRGRPSKKDARSKARRLDVAATVESKVDKRRRAIWEIYWQPGLPWYPPVKEVAEQFGMTRQAVSNVRAWAVRVGLAVRTEQFKRYSLSPFDAIEMCKRCWGQPGECDVSQKIEDIVAEYGIARRTAYDVYRPRYISGELHAHAEALDRQWRESA